MDLFGRRDGIQQLIHVVETEMTVLQQDPASVSHRWWQDAASVNLLALTHRDRPAFCQQSIRKTVNLRTKLSHCKQIYKCFCA